MLTWGITVYSTYFLEQLPCIELLATALTTQRRSTPLVTAGGATPLVKRAKHDGWRHGGWRHGGWRHAAGASTCLPPLLLLRIHETRVAQEGVFLEELSESVLPCCFIAQSLQIACVKLA